MYRLVGSNPPSPDDFLSHVELANLGRMRRYWQDDCRASGLSVCSNLDDIKRLRSSIGPLRSKEIALGNTDGTGVMMATPAPNAGDSHHTWWLRIPHAVWTRFRTVT